MSGKTERPVVRSDVNTLVLLVFGQSNAINIAPSTTFVASSGTENFNFYNGKSYVAVDPLLGCESAGVGCFATKLASSMVDNALAQRVVVANMAIGATKIADWAPGGFLAERPRFAIRQMLQAGIPPDFVLCMQGESDNVAGTSAASYSASQRAVVAELRKNGCSAPYFISLTTKYENITTGYATVRQGQGDACSDELGIFQGPDTDTLGDSYRFDGTHFTDAGNTAHSALWLPVLQNWIATH